MENTFNVNFNAHVDPIYEVSVYSKIPVGKNSSRVHVCRLSAPSETAALDAVLKKLLFYIPGNDKVCPEIRKFLSGGTESPFTEIKIKKIRDDIPDIPVTYTYDLPDLHGVSFVKGEKYDV